jgi:serine/threonine protein kinase
VILIDLISGVAEVFSAVEKKSKRKVAIKKMSLENSAITKESLVGEIAIMKSCRHKNIVEYVNTYKVGKQIWVVMEYMGMGSLTDILEQFPTMPMNESQIAAICQGVKFCFSFYLLFICLFICLFIYFDFVFFIIISIDIV